MSSSSSSSSSFLQSAEWPVTSKSNSFCYDETSTKSERLKERNSTLSSAIPNVTPLRHSTSECKVMYFIDNSVTSISFAERHFMRPSRVRVLHSLIHSLGLDRRMEIAIAPPASEIEMCIFHRRAYVACLQSAPCICADPLIASALSFQQEFDVPVGSARGDCPLFPEIWELVCSQAGGSLACARALLTQRAQIAINWAGGMHHAAAAHASGFCYINDAVLCIKHLLQKFQRVLYVDLDVHHGDGVESAFYGNPRVMTCSLHQFGDKFFPGTGDYASSLSTETVNNSFAINVPLPARTGDAAYVASFQLVLSSILSCYDPEVLVVQCGADTIAGDLIGRLCLSTVAHAHCVQTLLQLQLPIILLGGGGYHVFHTAQCWAINTACACGLTLEQLPLYIPECDVYYKYYRAESCPLRPRLHVLMDKDVDHALSLEESQIHWRKLCASLPCQLHAARCLREKFTRMVRGLVLCHKRTRETTTTTNNTKASHSMKKQEKEEYYEEQESLGNDNKVADKELKIQSHKTEQKRKHKKQEKKEVLIENDSINSSGINDNNSNEKEMWLSKHVTKVNVEITKLD